MFSFLLLLLSLGIHKHGQYMNAWFLFCGDYATLYIRPTLHYIDDLVWHARLKSSDNMQLSDDEWSTDTEQLLSRLHIITLIKHYKNWNNWSDLIANDFAFDGALVRVPVLVMWMNDRRAIIALTTRQWIIQHNRDIEIDFEFAISQKTST